MKTIAVVAPHPDDETLGCGGTLLKARKNGGRVHWIVATRMTRAAGYTAARIRFRRREQRAAAGLLGFSSTHELGFPAGGLDRVPMGDLVAALKGVLARVRPDTLFVPHAGDAHSDHRVAFAAAAAAAKTFRLPSMKRLLSYETPSETEFGLGGPPFVPNSYCDISLELDAKISAFRAYAQEGGEHPFPRSETNIRALAAHRGATAGCAAAEAFMLHKEIW